MLPVFGRHREGTSGSSWGLPVSSPEWPCGAEERRPSTKKPSIFVARRRPC
jgi:hypothetical protein